MSTLGGILSIARTALGAHQASVQVASHNIANAETPGYTRQRAELVANYPSRQGLYNMGTGVRMGAISRMRDAILDDAYRRQAAHTSGYGAKQDILTRVQEMFAEPSENGLAAQLDAFWNAWSDLATNPLSQGARFAVQQRGQAVAGILNNYGDSLTQLERRTTEKLDAAVTDFNALSKQVAQLNQEITATEVGGRVASDLRDMRDLLLDRMATFGEIQVLNQPNGATNVVMGTTMIVDGSVARDLEFRPRSSGVPALPARVGIAGKPDIVLEPGGLLGASRDVINVDLVQMHEKLDGLAAALVTEVNARHMTGWTPTGAGVAFFDPTGTRAHSISVSAAIIADPSLIAASSTANEPSDNNLALSLAGLRTNNTVTVNGQTGVTINDVYNGMVTTLGFSIRTADNSRTVHEALQSQLGTRRQGVSGVSVDEELIQIMRSQAAYTAAARLVNVADEMTQTLLGIGR